MIIIKRKRFWKSDVVATEAWLNQMHLQGYALQSANLQSGKFAFVKAEPETVNYRIGYEKNSYEERNEYLKDGGFEKVCNSKDYYIIKTKNKEPHISPSYDKFLDKNVKRKFIVGMILLCNVMLVLPYIIMWIGSFVFLLMDQFEYGAFIVMCVFAIFFSVPLLILSFYFKKLRRINKKLESLCGKPLNLSWTIPQDTVLSKQEIQTLKKEKRYVKKLKLAWFYSPDKTEAWLEKMEESGFNLIRMGKIGAGIFRFTKGTPRKIKYHIDYQNKTNPAYYDLHRDNGWKLFFTSFTRIQSFSVWAKEYADEIPLFYSDNHHCLKHARRLALTYSLVFLPTCAAYIALLAWYIRLFIDNGFVPMFLPIIILYPILIIEFGVFAIKTICYYFRIRKSLVQGKSAGGIDN